MVRRAERTRLDQRMVDIQEPGDGVDARDIEALVHRHLRQDPGDPGCEHRLARAGRADEQEVMPARGGDLCRPLSRSVTPNFTKIRARRKARSGRRVRARRLEVSSEEADTFLEARDGDDADVLDQGGLRRIGRRAYQPRSPRLLAGDRSRKRTSNRSHRSVQGQLPDRHPIGGTALRKTTIGRDHSDRYGQIEVGAVFPEGSRREVGSNPCRRPSLAARGQGGAHPPLRLPYRFRREPDDRELRHSLRDVDLYLHEVCLRSQEGDGGGS
jgi:hypothetical protein